MAVNSTTFEPDAAFAFYYQGLVLSRCGRGERALRRFRAALVTELLRDAPDGHNLRLFRDKVREVEESLNLPRSPRRSPAPPPR